MAGRKLIRPAVFKTKSDAGPEGVGVVVYDQHEVMPALTWARDLPWARDLKNKFQNQREYVGLNVAMILLHRVCQGRGVAAILVSGSELHWR